MNMMNLPSDKLYSIRQIRDIEHNAFKHTPEKVLMERAGCAAFNALQGYYPTVQKLTVVCGPGNNGGDGLVVARLAREAGLEVQVLTVGGFEKQTWLSKEMLKSVNELNISCLPLDSVNDFQNSELIVDALLGTGVKGQVKAPFDAAIQAINAAKLPVFSLDLPSGLNADTGQPCGDCVIAQQTLTFIGFKQGMLTGQARQYCGQIECDDIGIADAINQQQSAIHLLGKEALASLKPNPLASAHKGTQGHVVIVGGDTGMPGAVCLAAEAALRVGAGKVTIVTREKHFPIVMNKRSEFICLTVEEDFSALEQVLQCADVCVIGPGMMASTWSRQVYQYCMAFTGPKVLDAGALSLLAETPQRVSSAILTPHPGEAARLLSIGASEVETDRFQVASEIVHKYADVVVLKGAGSLICSNKAGMSVCALGNSGMATAGMGDVLAGIIGGLIKQYDSLDAAAIAGVLLHSHAGDLVAQKQGCLNLLAGDLFNYFDWGR